MVPILVICGVALGLSGDYCFRTADFLSQRFLLGFVLYTVSGVPVFMVYQRTSFMYVALLWSLLALIVSVGIATFLLGEALSARKWLAFGMALGAILVWNWGK